MWDPLTGEIVQLVSILRAGCALVPASPPNVNTEGRICVQIGVLGYPAAPFTDGLMIGADSIVSWLDSWGVSRNWPAGRPTDCQAIPSGRSRVLWAKGGHFGASQVPACDNSGPGAIDTCRLTGPHAVQVHRQRSLDAELADALQVSA